MKPVEGEKGMTSKQLTVKYCITFKTLKMLCLRLGIKRGIDFVNCYSSDGGVCYKFTKDSVAIIQDYYSKGRDNTRWFRRMVNSGYEFSVIAKSFPMSDKEFKRKILDEFDWIKDEHVFAFYKIEEYLKEQEELREKNKREKAVRSVNSARCDVANVLKYLGLAR